MNIPYLHLVRKRTRAARFQASSRGGPPPRPARIPTLTELRDQCLATHKRLVSNCVEVDHLRELLDAMIALKPQGTTADHDATIAWPLVQQLDIESQVLLEDLVQQSTVLVGWLREELHL